MATTAGVRRSELPGWFWGALGCMTVLAVGLAAVFFVGQQTGRGPRGAASAPPAVISATSVAPGAPIRAADVQRGQVPGIRIEPMAPPPAAVEPAAVPAAPPVVARPKAPVRPLKVARSPAAAPKPAVASKPAAADNEDDSGDEPRAKPASRAATAAAQDETEEK